MDFFIPLIVDGPLTFTADDLLCATAEIMGKSTYGTVYKATLEDGSEVAGKRLREKIARSPRKFEEIKLEFASSSGDDSGAGVSGSGYGAALPLSSPLQMTE